ncbi:MAG: hypothetical protein JSS36_11490 [Proteobacteria bacterium]|nr:hypothetical protein [Pseudomonadota bacterium]
MKVQFPRIPALLAAAGAAALLAACGEQAPKVVTAPPPPPAPRVAEVVPPRPLPPFGALPNLAVPPRGADGVRETVNARISPSQTLWNLRSAFNVAALDCTGPEYAAIIPAYRAFLKKHKAVLAATNKALDAEYQARYGKGFVIQRESYETQVYNYFAYPQTMRDFCDATLTMSQAVQAVAPAELPAFSQQRLPAIEAVFERFFTAYDQYRADAAAWDARYAGRISAASAPAWQGGAAQPANPR